MEMFNCSVALRTEMLRCKFEEMEQVSGTPEAMVHAKVNPYVFIPMGRVPCTPRAVIASVTQRCV
jgi:hypothetical protein